MFFRILVALVIMALSVSGLTHRGFGRRLTMAMNANAQSPYGQKLGQSIISTAPAPVGVESTGTLFRRSPIGSGHDERFGNDYSDEDIMESQKTLYGVGKSLKMLSLVSELEGSRWGQTEKIARISLASSADGILPTGVVGGIISPSLSSGNLHSGGLFSDWNSEM